MIKEIKEKLKSAWEWTKKKVKKFKKWIIALLIPIVLAAPLLIPPNRSFENLPNVIKEEALYRIKYDKWSEVEIPEIAMPEAVLKKWGDETWIKISYPDFHPVNPKQHQGKLKWENTDKEVHLYPTKVGEIDVFEFEVVLKEKPASNVITLGIESQGLNFDYQPELTQEEIDSGHFRPENVVGSYAVYHSTKGNMHAGQEEAEKYKTSKAFHIYRPKLIDSNGWEVWGELNIDEQVGKLRVRMPDDFWNNAVYPVRHATGLTFGFTSKGGTAATFASFEDNNYATIGSKFAGAAGTLVSLHCYITDEFTETTNSPSFAQMGLGTPDWRGAIFEDGVDGVKVDEGNRISTDGSETPGFQVNSSGIEQVITAQDYWLYWAVYDENFNDTCQVIYAHYDSGGDSRNNYGSELVGTVFPATLDDDDFSTNGTNKFSIYATYTPAAEERRIIIIE